MIAYRRGFSLIELLLAVAALSLIAGVMIPVAQSFQNSNSGAVAAAHLEQAARRASMLARAGAQDSAWGVNVQTGAIVLYAGSSFATRVVAYDESFPIASSLIIGGATDYLFPKFTGSPAAAATTTFTTPNNHVHSVSLTAKGVAAY
jgi:prepilin-type N-terminal cleavage/methylation domain-containing protein